jgi:hypothetical protein
LGGIPPAPHKVEEEDLGKEGIIIIIIIIIMLFLKNSDGRAWTGLLRFRTGTGGGRL